MISPDQLPLALKALERLLVHCKARAYESGDSALGELLNDIELLPEYLGDERDCSSELVELLQGIAQMHPSCRYIAEEFERASLPAT